VINTDARVARLTARERDVLALLSAGHSDFGIGNALFVTQKTVEFHARNIFRKLELPADRSVNRRVLAAVAFIHDQAEPG
jgi:DNA-binding NarL/FixJ family response regulator